MKTPQDIMSFGQANIEAYMKSGQIFATGLQDFAKLMASTAQTSMDETMSAFRALTTVKSVKEAIELQTSFARSTMQKAVAQTGQVAETSFKLAEQTLAPITNRATFAVESFKTV